MGCGLVWMRGRHLEAAAIGVDEGIVSIGVRLQASLYAQAVNFSSLLQLLVVDAHHDESAVGHLHQPTACSQGSPCAFWFTY